MSNDTNTTTAASEYTCDVHLVTDSDFPHGQIVEASAISDKNAAAPSEDPNTYTFKKPFVFEDETYKSVTFDFDSLTGADLTGAQKYYSGKGNFAIMPAYDMGYCAIIAAIAAGKPFGFFEKVSAKDFVSVTQKATHFLTVAD
jgi:hypothetical protein